MYKEFRAETVHAMELPHRLKELQDRSGTIVDIWRLTSDKAIIVYWVLK